MAERRRGMFQRLNCLVSMRARRLLSAARYGEEILRAIYCFARRPSFALARPRVRQRGNRSAKALYLEALEQRQLFSVMDGSFESYYVGEDDWYAYEYHPPETDWTFVGGSGIAALNSGFYPGNGLDGNQFAILQQYYNNDPTWIEQSVYLDAGDYTVDFIAAQREWASVTNEQIVQVSIDGHIVGVVTPSSTTFEPYSLTFTVGDSGDHKLRFTALAKAAGDNTIFIDDVCIDESEEAGSANPVPAPSSFTAVADSGTQVTLTWVGILDGGVTDVNYYYVVNRIAPDGYGVEFLIFPSEGDDDGYGNFDFVDTGLDPETLYYYFVQAWEYFGDGSDFIEDEVTTDIPYIAPWASWDNLLEDGSFDDYFLEGTGWYKYEYQPDEGNWTFVGGAGIAGLGSGFFPADGAHGSQFAMLQQYFDDDPTWIEQSMSLAAGNYSLSFLGAQREWASVVNAQIIQVSIDGNVIGTVTPGSTTFASYNFSFSASAGTHVLKIAAIAGHVGDNTAFVDNVRVDKKINEGSNFQGTLTLASSETITDVLVDWGDGSTPADHDGALSHVYEDSGTYWINVTATDDHGSHLLSHTRIVVASNVAPGFSLAGNSTVNEGADYALTLNRTDPGLDTLSAIKIDWGDGHTQNFSSLAWATGTANKVFHHTYADGNATGSPYTISIMSATDEDGNYTFSTYTKLITVNNVTPTFAAAASSPVPGGNLAQYVLTRSDPGADTVSNVLINWGDGHTQNSSTLGSVLNLTHIYESSGNFTISATITDEDGTYSAATTLVNVSTTSWSIKSALVSQDEEAPTISGFATSSVADAAITLQWTASDNTEVERIRIFRNGVAIADLSGANSSFTDESVNAGTSYDYSIRAYDLAGNFSNLGTLTTASETDAVEPDAPVGFRAVVATVTDALGSADIIRLQWQPALDNPRGSGVVGYRLYRYDESEFDYVLIAEPAGTNYEDTNLPDSWTVSNFSAQIQYQLRSVDAEGLESLSSSSLKVTPSNMSLNQLGLAIDQYIPQAYRDFFNNLTGADVDDLTARYRELVDEINFEPGTGSLQYASAQGWLDADSGAVIATTPDMVFIDNPYGQSVNYLPLLSDGYFYDSNSNFRYDSGEPAWRGYDEFDSLTSIVLTGSPTNGMDGAWGISYLPSGTSVYDIAGYNSANGDQILANLGEIRGTGGHYLFFDQNGNGKWDGGYPSTSGEPVWRDNNSDGKYQSTDTIVFAGSYTVFEEQLGKSSGIYFADVAGKRIIWADQSNFAQDVAALYQGIDELITRGGENTVAQATGWSVAATGTVTIGPGSPNVTGSGSHFLSELRPNDWIKVGTGSWYQVMSITSDTLATIRSDSIYHDGVPITGTLTYSGWTLIPEVATPEAATGLEFNYDRGTPNQFSPLFREHFAELRAALNARSGGGLSTGLDAAPTLTLSHSIEMDLRNVVADSNLDGIINIPVSLSSFGNDTGVITADPRRGMGQVYVPITVDATGELPVHAYLLQGAFGAATGERPLASHAWTYADIDESGLSWGYSLNERVVVNMYINTNENHIARMTVYRPGGNAVTFDFAWDEETKSFSEWGYPVGARDGYRTYVLHASAVTINPGGDPHQTGAFFDNFDFQGFNGDPDLPAMFELRFDDGTVHEFNSSGYLSGIRTADGRSVSISGLGISGTNNTPTTAASLAYDVTLNFEDGRLAAVDYRSRLIDNSTDVITTTLSYISTASGFSLINGLAKEVSMNEPDHSFTLNASMPEFSYSVTGGTSGDVTNTVVISNNAGHNTITRSGSATAATITYESDSLENSDDYTFNATTGMLTSFTHNLGTSSATTTYLYNEGTGRFELTGAAQWAKITEILHPNGSWEGYAYDHNGSTGWMTAYITPFKGTTAPSAGSLAGMAEGGSGVNVESYYYDAAVAGGGDPVDFTAIRERPRQVVYTTNEVILGVSFRRYMLSDGDYGGRRTMTTREGEFAVLDGGALATYNWDYAAYETVTVFNGRWGIGADFYSPLESTTYEVEPLSNGLIEVTTSAATEFGTLWSSRQVITPFGTVVEGDSTRITITTSDFTTTYDGFGSIWSSYDAITDTEASWSYVEGATVSWWGPLTVISEDGVESNFTYDALGRVETESSRGITTTYTYDGDGNVVGVSAAAGSLTISSSAEFDALRRIVEATNEIGKVTTYDYATGSGVITVTATYNANGSDSATLITQSYIDGSRKAVYGTATDRVNYDYGVHATLGYFERTITNTGNTDTTSTSSGFVSTVYYNSLWLPYRYESTGPNDTAGNATTLVSLVHYDSSGRVWAEVEEATGSRTVTEYDPATGEVIDTFTLADGQLTESSGQSTFGYSAFDTGTYPTLPSTGNAQVTTTRHNGETTGMSATSVDGLDHWSVDMNGGSPFVASETHTVIDPDTKSNWVTTSEFNDGTRSVSIYEGGLLTKTQSFGADTGSGYTLLSQNEYTYDPFFRTHSVTTWTGGTGTNSTTTSVTYTYRANGQISRTDYSDGTFTEVNAWSGATDQPTSTTARDGTTTTRTFNPKGEMTSISGGGNTPVSMSNNATTGTSTLTTYKGFSGSFGSATGAATTTWNVDPRSGRMKSKVYADNSSISYYYRSDGKLDHTLYGGVTTTYGYTGDGRQNSVTYTQSGQTTIKYATEAYDQWGNATIISETLTPYGAGSSGSSTILESFGYDPINHALTSRTYNYASVGNIRFGLNIDYSHSGADANRMTGIELIRTSATNSSYSLTLTSAAYGYDDAGRLQTITGDATTTFGYDLGTGAQSSVTTELSGDDLVTTKHYNGTTGKLESIVTMRGATLIEREDYTYPASGSHLNQLSRKQVARLLDNGSTEHFYITYSYDALNQLTGVTTYNGVYGSTESHATLATQTWAFDAQGNRTDVTTNNMNQITVDENSHAQSYDARGNLIQTYTFNYTYDSLNRLTSVIPTDHSKYKSVYTYDHANRRTSETLYAWNSGTSDWSTTATKTTYFLYNGMNLVAEIDANSGYTTKSYTWDPTKYGGVGGLLSISTYTGGTITGTYVPYFNSHGDVLGLVNEATGNVTATYTYQAYGQVTITGNGTINAFRWQTAYQLDATDDSATGANDGIYVIGIRDALKERWMQRDPSGEHGGQNGLYVVDSGDPINRFDPDGRADVPSGPQPLGPPVPPDIQMQLDWKLQTEKLIEEWEQKSLEELVNNYNNLTWNDAGLQDMLNGIIAHRIIGLFYDPLGNRAWLNLSIGRIVREAPGNINLIPPRKERLRPDIVERGTFELYEIKTTATGAKVAKGEALQYIAILAAAGLPAQLGSPANPGTTGNAIMPNGSSLTWSSPQSGVILYTIKPPPPKLKLVLIPDPVKKTIDDHIVPRMFTLPVHQPAFNPRPKPSLDIPPVPVVPSPGFSLPKLTMPSFSVPRIGVPAHRGPVVGPLIMTLGTVTTVVLVADDVTVIGVVDDVAIPVSLSVIILGFALTKAGI